LAYKIKGAAMETVFLILIFCTAVFLAARHIKKTIKDGEACHKCDKGKRGGCGR